MNRLTFVLYFLHPISLAIPPPVLQLQRRKAIVTDYFENCENKDYVWMYQNFSFVKDTASIHINGVMAVERDLRGPIAVQYRLDRCKNRSDRSSCEQIMNIKCPDLCSASKIDPAIATFLRVLKPQMPCPAKKNLYFVRNMELPLDSVSFIMTTGTRARPLMKFRCIVSEKNERIACLDAGWKILEIRARA